VSEKYPYIMFRVDTELKRQVWEEATRLKMTPSRWLKQTIKVGLVLSSQEATPEEYVISLTREEYSKLRKEGVRITCTPLED